MADWSLVEVEATISDYFAMLEAELRGETYSKAEHRRALSRLLNGRTDGSIERKHQNISAILIERGLPYIDGYKPLRNYQQLLFDAVVVRLEHAPTLVRTVASDVTRPASVPAVPDILEALVDPPRPSGKTRYPKRVRERHVPRPNVDYLAIEAANRSLGAAGEAFVLNFERARLIRAGKETLAERIEHVSVDRGDGAGFDIRSFESSGADRLIEVKTTRYGQETPFYVSRNELAVSRERDASYHLYRVFDFRRRPSLFLKRGQLDHAFALDPNQYVARIA